MRSSRIAIVAACTTIAIVPATALINLWRHHDQAEAAMRREADLQAVAIAAHANQVFIAADQTLDGLERQLNAGGGPDERRLRERFGGWSGHQALSQRLDPAGIVYDIYAVDAAGHFLASGHNYPAAETDVSARPVFQFHRSHPTDHATFVGAPLRDETQIVPALLLSRSLSSPRGEFIGVLMVAVSTSYFQSYYDDLVRHSGPVEGGEAALALVRDDGIILARSSGAGAPRGARIERTGPYARLPAASSPGWRSLSEGEYAPLAPWAARSRDSEVAIVHLTHYPVSVIVSINPAVFESAWTGQCLEIGELSLLSLVFLSVAFTWLIRTLRAKEQQHEELQRLNEKADAANRAKSEFLSTISHEIRTPLNGIIGTAELIRLGPLGDDQRRFADTLLRSAQGLLALIGEVLDFAKIESGKLEIDRLPFDVQPLVRDVAALFTATASAKGLLLELRVDDALPTVLGDAAHLRQVLANLVSNAVKFTERGTIVLQASRVDPSDDGDGRLHVRFAVSDSGIGITPEVKTKLFVPFQQGDSSVARRFGGSGLGLAISSRLVEAMGGRLEVADRHGGGTTFCFDVVFEMPMVGVPATRLAEMGSETPRPAAQAISPARILLVEDDETNCLVISAQLTLMGHHCTVAVDGSEALAQRESVRPALVLMDCNLPRISGYETARRWRELERRDGTTPIPIVALSANTTEENLEACRAAGMDDFIPKPCGLERLRAALERWLVDKDGAT